MIYILLCVIICGSGVIGLSISQKYATRCQVYKCMVAFVDYLMMNIYHLNETIDKTIDKFLESSKTCKNQILEIKNYICTMDNHNKKNNMLFDELSEIQNNEIYDFMNTLGKSNTETQLHILSNYKTIFEKRLLCAEQDNKQKGSIAFRLSIFIGITICVLII